MSDFSQDIKNFRQNGTYTYKFDEVGNLTFNSSSSDFSKVCVAFPLVNIFYNNNKLDAFYNPNFEEFVPTTSSLQPTASVDILQQMDSIQQENALLKTQLDSLVAQSETSSSVADQMATKQVIFELRKALGQGRVESDFSDTFPYTPIRKPVLKT